MLWPRPGVKSGRGLGGLPVGAALLFFLPSASEGIALNLEVEAAVPAPALAAGLLALALHFGKTLVGDGLLGLVGGGVHNAAPCYPCRCGPVTFV